MRILIDILHPAHVHFFRNFAQEMRMRGHEIRFTARAKECATDLLDHYGIPYTLLSRQKSGLALASELAVRTWKLVQLAIAWRPDVMTGIMGPSIALAGRTLGVPAVVFYDTEFARQTNWFVYPLAHSVCTPDCYQGSVRGVHRTYPGYHELAYLHPDRFTPDPVRLRRFGVSSDEPYSILRFVSWQAIHDVTEKGLTGGQKRHLIDVLERRGRVLISSEAPLTPDLDRWRLRGPTEDIHHLLAFAQMIVGESATMSSEAAVLGVPAIFIAKTGRGYTDDEERTYGLVRHFQEAQFEHAVAAIEDLFGRGPRTWGGAARARLLADKIDVTAWMVNYFEEEFLRSEIRPARREGVPEGA
jgi:predicted glycosyltransferase